MSDHAAFESTLIKKFHFNTLIGFCNKKKTNSKFQSVVVLLNRLQQFLSRHCTLNFHSSGRILQSFLNRCYTERNDHSIICTPKETQMFDASFLDLFTMNLFTELLALARVIHESSALPTLFCRLTFTPLIESVLYKI